MSEFMPIISVVFKYRPPPFYVVDAIGRISVPDNITKLPFDEAVDAVCRLYKQNRLKYGSKEWPSEIDFKYHRRYGGSMTFDVSRALIERDNISQLKE